MAFILKLSVFHFKTQIRGLPLTGGRRSLAQGTTSTDVANFMALVTNIPSDKMTVLNVVSQSMEVMQLCSNIIGHASLTAVEALNQVLTNYNYTDLGDIYTETYRLVRWTFLAQPELATRSDSCH